MNVRQAERRRRRMVLGGLLMGGAGLLAAGDGSAGGVRFASISSVSLELSAVGVVAEGILVADDEMVGSVLFVERRALESAGSSPPASLIKNVEGLAWRDGSLCLGLRAPLSEGATDKALIFSASEKAL